MSKYPYTEEMNRIKNVVQQKEEEEKNKLIISILKELPVDTDELREFGQKYLGLNVSYESRYYRIYKFNKYTGSVAGNLENANRLLDDYIKREITNTYSEYKKYLK